jgi:hypothetical protein
MDAKELRIGNWCSDCEGCNYQVTALSILNMVNFSNGYNPCSIPLTEDWLVKFGFEKVSGWDYYKGWIKDYVELECDCYGFDYVNNIDKEVKHVHQLQNLYFALTGEELELI